MLLKFIRFIFFLFIVIIIATLPFHYVYEEVATIEETPNFLQMVFPKKELTFDNTFINTWDLIEFDSKYHKADRIEKSIMKNDPLYSKLIEKGLIKE